MSDWEPGEVRAVPIDALRERYRRYRLPDAEAEAALARSLGRYGQVAPLVVCLREESPEVIDGFKRLAAARTLPGMKALSARLLAADERAAKAAIYGLNRASRPVQELEEAWVVHAYPFQCVICHFSAACFFTRLASSSWAVETCGCFLL